MSLKRLLERTAERKKPLVVSIDGEELKFRRLRVEAMNKARNVVQRVAEAVTAFFDPSADQYVQHTHVREKDGSESTVVEAIDSDVAAKRQQQREASVSKAVATLFDEQNIEALCVLVLDSLREPYDDEAIAAFRKDLEVDDLGRLVFYMLRANLSVLGTAGEAALGKAKGKLVSLFGNSAGQEEGDPPTTKPDGGIS